MFDLREWLKEGYLDAVGKRPDYWIILNATGWYRDGVLLQEDLAEIKAKIDEKNAPVEEVNSELISENNSANSELSNDESEVE